ncbi:MAG: SusF/SusE family outer membrane protein [Saprospiraceae bacterium]
MPLVLLLSFVAVSCGDDDDDTTPTPTIEDGVYVFGEGTAVTTIGSKGLMKAATNEAKMNEARTGLYDLYIAVKAGSQGFNIGKVDGGKTTTLGPGANFAKVEDADKITDEPRGWLSRGSTQETTTKFTVPEDGLYHVVYDEQLNIVTVAKADWGIIGGATPNGWGGSTAMTSSAFDLNAMSFEVKDLILLVGEYKFRYSDGWKIVLDGENVRANTNFGGAANALVAGGGNIQNTVVGVYTAKIDWSLANGITATMTKTGDYTPPAYPSEMYIVGDATPYGWDTPGTKADGIMHKLAGGSPTEGIFWKICSLEGGKGFKVSAAEWKEPNLGHSNISEFDGEGVSVTADGGGNLSVAESGMYIVVLNLRDNGKKLSVKPAEVYGIGDAFGSWDSGVEAYKFTANNTDKTFVSPAFVKDAAVRMYAAHSWIPDWWNAEFRVDGGKIDYRNDGGDQAAVNGTAGQKVTLKFDDNTGSIQ